MNLAIGFAATSFGAAGKCVVAAILSFEFVYLQQLCKPLG
jgi:hypothetical protein